MRHLVRYSLLLMALVLTGCAATTQRQYEGCIVGTSAVGGAIGAAGSGGSAAIPGVAGGAAVGAIVCRPPPEPEPAPRTVAPVAPVDSDGDGVADGRDACPGTAPGVAVDARGCPRDSDSDGVPDNRDRCPGTPAGVRVDDSGCPLPEEVMLRVDRLQFAFDSAALDARAKSALDAAVDVIRSHASVQLDVVGYTDASGPEAYNQRLSERRAQAAVDYLVSRGADREQLRAVGRGEADPVADNGTRDGRERNRRVELVVR